MIFEIEYKAIFSRKMHRIQFVHHPLFLVALFMMALVFLPKLGTMKSRRAFSMEQEEEGNADNNGINGFFDYDTDFDDDNDADAHGMPNFSSHSSPPPPPSISSSPFKEYSHLIHDDEIWPADFYPSVMSICRLAPSGKLLPRAGYAHCEDGGKEQPQLVAIGHYRNAQQENGWGILEIQTFPDVPEEVQAYAAGLLEGALAKRQIANHYRNTVDGMCKNEAQFCRKLRQYLSQNLEWIRSEVHSHPASDLYWRHVNLTFIQLTGINDAYRHPNGPFLLKGAKFVLSKVLLLQLAGEMYDLDGVFNRTSRGQFKSGHCSALIKLVDGNADLLVSHNTMAGFESMNRLVKYYKFAYDSKAVPGHSISYSGYPGVLASIDDYTLTSGGLLSLETTIDVFNESLYRLVKPRGQLHCWLRSYIANQLAGTGHDWVKIFARHNSGTYNNQWMVVDYKLFKPGHAELPNANLLWVLEQMPGLCVMRDLTWFLRKHGNWVSYNVPFFTKIAKLSGQLAMAKANAYYSWQNCPRGRIFRRDVHKVQTMASLRELIRYNNYQNDEFSKCQCNPPYTAVASIATRSDLNPPNGTWELPEMGFRNFGTLDYKGTNVKLFKQLRFELIGGPTNGGPGNLPVFSWENTSVVASHEGQPMVWNFKPFVTLWQNSVNQEL